MQRFSNSLGIAPLSLIVTLMLSGCQGLNQRIGQFDAAADKAVVDNVDNSQINQSINSGLNKAGDAVNSILPGVMRPPPERLSPDESRETGESPDPSSLAATAPAPQADLMQAPPVQSPPVLAPGISESAQPIASDESPVDLTELRAAGVTLKRSNIRMGPGLDHDIVDTVAAGTPLSISGRTPDGWLLVDRNGAAFGFVFGELVRLAD